MKTLATKIVRVTGARLRYPGAWLLLAIGTSFSTVASAGPGVWTSGGPYGGDVRALAIDPSTPATLYAGTGGAVIKSTNGGGTWNAINAGLTSGPVSALAIDPSTPATVYAGTSAGVFKSANGGGSWSAVNAGLTSTAVSVLAIDPSAPATLYAGTAGGVFKSTDGGGSWSAVNNGLTSTDGLSIHALAIDPLTPGTLYAGFGTFINGAPSGGVFKSTDRGGSWSAVNNGLTGSAVHALAIDPRTPATLYAGTSGDVGKLGGVFKSTDGGGTWVRLNAAAELIADVGTLAIDPRTPATLYASAITDYPCVIKSTDGGSSWIEIETGLDKILVSALAIDPAAPATLYAATFAGVFKSTDGGDNWGPIDAGLANGYVSALAIDPKTPATLYAGTAGGVMKSTDSGRSWSAVNAGLAHISVVALAVDPATPTTLYAGTFHGVFKSTNGGGSWSAVNNGLIDSAVDALAIDPSTPTTIYAGTYQGFFGSTNGGGSWSALNNGLPSYSGGPNVSALAIDPKTPATFYAGVGGYAYDISGAHPSDGVFKSTNGGASWSAAQNGLPSYYGSSIIKALAIDPSSPTTLYAGTTGDGIFKSTDSGGTWATARTGLTDPWVTALAIDPTIPATLYAGTNSGGVFRSTDSGGTWATVNAGLPNLGVSALALDPTGATTLYAGLYGGGVWQATRPTGTTNALLPTSAHSSGANGAFYTTNVSVSNVGAAPASFTLKFLGNNQDGSNGPEKTFSLDPGKSTTFVDVLGSVFSQTSNFGAIRITSNTSTLDIVSATSTPGFGGTFGQAIPAISFADLVPAGSARSILYIREGDGFRSNLILASGSFVSTDVDVALVSPAGETLATKTYSVPPNGMTQINRVVRDMGVSGLITGARLVLSSSTAGAAFTGFASVIDETTNDPTAVLVQPASVSGSAPYIWLLPTSAHSSGANGAFYTTNVAVANVGAAPASFTMKFLGNNQDGSGGPEETFNLESGKSVVYFDVLGSVFHQTSAFGAIRITSDTPSLNVVSVTSTPGFGGTLSQTISAVRTSDLIPAGSQRSILYIREGDGFRSNLILASGADVSTTVDAALVSPAGETLATKSYSVPPNGMTQINRVVRDMGVSGLITGARLVASSSTPSAAFTGFASVIDEITNDPTAVEAR